MRCAFMTQMGLPSVRQLQKEYVELFKFQLGRMSTGARMVMINYARLDSRCMGFGMYSLGSGWGFG